MSRIAARLLLRPTARASTRFGRTPSFAERFSLLSCATSRLGRKPTRVETSSSFSCATSQLGRDAQVAKDVLPDIFAGSSTGASRPFSQARFLFQSFSPKARKCVSKPPFPVPQSRNPPKPGRCASSPHRACGPPPSLLPSLDNAAPGTRPDETDIKKTSLCSPSLS